MHGCLVPPSPSGQRQAIARAGLVVLLVSLAAAWLAYVVSLNAGGRVLAELKKLNCATLGGENAGEHQFM